MIQRLAIPALVASFLALGHGQDARAADSPFEGDLMRLSEILGSLHYLRNLCGESGQDWRGRMEALIAAENPDDERRAKLTASFNRGYRSFETTYTTCTSSALAAIARYMKEGEALSRDTATRYGN
ncbi:MAG: TIGR02301 family protein [Aquamicrobium sp.]|uniref:TIGR02301 family protein n=1 Tax=Aquamicrobium sp. TaxID=1872579 RepID=UPI00349EFB99|nr:TIGR02301 family protein [Aquamicrobium sp.]